MARPVRNVVISLGELGSFLDGLGEFSRQLCTRLAQQAPYLDDAYGLRLWFHLKPHLVGSFGPDVGYIEASRDQRHQHTHPEPFVLWHSLHQLNRTLPPESTRYRMVTVHDLNFLYFKGWFSRWRDMRRIRALIQRTDEIVTISRFVQQDVCRHLGWSGPIQTVHNGVTDLSSAPQEPTGWSGSSVASGSNSADVVCLGAASTQGYLFHISRMARSKNIRAILDLAAAWPDKPFVLAGPASRDVDQVRLEVGKRALDNVRILTSVTDAQKAWLFAHCDGLVFPSFAEGFGLPVIEAMHFGKPVFLSRLTSLPEVGGALAYYFDAFDGAAMREVVEHGLAKHREQQLAEPVRQWAAQFNWDRCAQQYLQIYIQRASR